MIEDNFDEKNEIEEEYKIWKKNTPFLYDILITKCLEWPSLTVNWIKKSHLISNNLVSYDKQQVLLGTQTSEQDKNYLIFANIKLPIKNSSSLEYSKQDKKIEFETLIEHNGDINKARINPFHDNIIASKSSTRYVYLFDKFKHPTKSENVGPQRTFTGHTAEGYGLTWSKYEDNILISGSDDNLICIWDINAQEKEGVIDPLIMFNDHSSIVEDVCSSPDNKNIFYSVSDDKTLKVFDFRESRCVFSVKAHEENVNTVDLNQINKYLLLTGSSDNTVGLWDIRKLSDKYYTFISHKEDVMSVRWNHKYENIFASGSLDRRINIWDISKIGMTQTPADMEDGPSELLFVHGGHISKVNDIDWNPCDGREFMIASVEEDNNNLHIFELANSLIPELNLE